MAAAAAAATDFLTATGFRFRPPSVRRKGERGSVRATPAALDALPKQFLFRSLSFALPTDGQGDPAHIHATWVVKLNEVRREA